MINIRYRIRNAPKYQYSSSVVLFTETNINIQIHRGGLQGTCINKVPEVLQPTDKNSV